MRRAVAVVFTGLVCAMLLAPLQAHAADAGTRVVGSVTGAQLASEFAGQIKKVQIGSSSATVTLDVAGTQSPVRIDFSDVNSAMEGGTGGWLTLAAIPMIGAAAVRFLHFLAKLGSN
jgi:hypothetical protein